MEIGKLKEEILNKDKYINGQRLEYTSKELDYNSQIESLQSKLDDKNSNYQLIFNKYEILEKEIFELVIYYFNSRNQKNLLLKQEK
jgi:hypothetical protein